MRTKLAIILSFFLLPHIISVNTPADVDIGLSVDKEGIKSFYLAIGDHYKAPEKEIAVVKKRKIPDEDLSVIFFLARSANVSSQAIIDLRLEGKTWMQITLHYGLGPGIYYVPVKEVKGPPYGKALGHFKNRPKNKWKEIVFDDIDIVNLVNLKFMSEYHGYSADEIIKMRAKGKNFILINDDIKKIKKEKKQKASNKEAKAKAKNKGKKKK